MNDALPLPGSPDKGVQHVRPKRFLPALRPLLALTVLCAGTASLAEAPAGLQQLELERLTLNPGATGSLVLGTGELLHEKGYRFSITGHYEKNPLEYFENQQYRGAVVGHRVTGHLAAAYGLTRRLELSAQVPLLLMQRGDDLTAFQLGRPSGGMALGTPYLGARLGLLFQEDTGNGVDLAVGLSAGLPLGSSAALARDSGLRVMPSIMVGRDFGPLRASVDVGMSLRKSIDFSENNEVGNELRLGTGVSTTGRGLRGELNVIAHVPMGNSSGNSVEALAGARLPMSSTLEAYAMAGVGFDKAPGTPTFRGLMGVAYGRNTRRPPPSKCEPGGKHTPEECPYLDDDVDHILNIADKCPLQGGNVDADGCPLPPPPQPKCLPEVAHTPQECPLLDDDKDKILNGADKCPLQGGNVDPDGCPIRTPIPEFSGRVQFETGSWDLDGKSVKRVNTQVMRQLADYLKKHPEIPTLWIEGHTDETGTPSKNDTLSEKRADAVLKRLVELDVEFYRLKAKGYGQKIPIDPSRTPEAWERNRRVDFFTTPRNAAQK